MPAILVDNNENQTSPETVKDLRKLFPDLLLVDLPFGDVKVITDEGRIVIIERKDPFDFLASIGDGRLFRQVEGMHNETEYCMIAITGHITYDKDDMACVNGIPTQWHGSSVRGAFFAVGWSGCPSLQMNREYYPWAIEELIRFSSKPDQHFQLKHKRLITFPPIDDKTDILAAFPGIGLKRAQALIESCEKSVSSKNGTLAKCLVWASMLPLIKPADRPVGWGNKTVFNFRETLGLETNEYLDIRENNSE